MYFVVLVVAAAICQVQTQQPVQEASPLAGPKVKAADVGQDSIIERGFDGLVKPAEPTPEEAALALLTLSDDEKARTREVLTRRARILDDFITHNIPLLTQFGVAEGGGNQKEQLALAYQALLKLKPLTDLGPLQNQLRDALTPANAEKFDATLKRYWNAYVKDRVRIRKPDGAFPSRLEIMAQAKIESLAKEGERAFKQMESGGDLIFQYLFKGITLRPEQSLKIHELLDAFARNTKGAATEQQNGQLFFAIIPVLDDTQRPKLLANIRELSGPKPAKKPRAER